VRNWRWYTVNERENKPNNANNDKEKIDGKIIENARKLGFEIWENGSDGRR
jgi:hypothetical protein